MGTLRFMNDNSVPTKLCSKCKIPKPTTDFGKQADRKDGLTSNCKECRRNYDSNRAETRRKKWREDPEYREKNKVAGKKYRDANTNTINQRQKEKKLKRRLGLIEKYGGKCECPGTCDEDRWEFLAIDHVYGGGVKERSELGITAYYKMLEDSPRLDRYRLLCHNCNSSLGYYGYCPHQKAPVKEPSGVILLLVKREETQ